MGPSSLTVSSKAMAADLRFMRRPPRDCHVGGRSLQRSGQVALPPKIPIGLVSMGTAGIHAKGVANSPRVAVPRLCLGVAMERCYNRRNSRDNRFTSLVVDWFGNPSWRSLRI